jgi:hypothetical protein
MRKLFAKLKRYLANKLHDWLMRVLLNGNEGLRRSQVNTKLRKINFGVFGSISTAYFEPRHEMALALLVKFYGYECYELLPTIVFPQMQN